MAAKSTSPISVEALDYILDKVDKDDLDALDAYKLRGEAVQYQIFDNREQFCRRLRNGFRVLFNASYGGDNG